MASDIDICNLALARIGDDANVSSIDPPEGSAQADHCARFFPIARDSMLEMHEWGFATTRAPLALLSATPPSTWGYEYAAPNDVLNYIAVLDPTAPADESVSYPPANAWGGNRYPQSGLYTPQYFTTETNAAGQTVILTNQQNAVLRYSRRVTDSSQFSPLFVDALGWLLASYLAGPVLKGATGAAMAKTCNQFFRAAFSEATMSDASQQYKRTQQSVAWITNR